MELTRQGCNLWVPDRDDNFSFLEFEAQLKKELDQLGVDLLKVVLESLDQQLRNSSTRKQTWTIVRKNDRKEILTPFGLLSYMRSYYHIKRARNTAILLTKRPGSFPIPG